MLKHLHPTPNLSSRIVIMGAGGFIGSTVANALESKGARVLCLTRKEINLLEKSAADKLHNTLQPGDVFVAASAIAPCKTPAMLRDNMVMAEIMVSALSRSQVAHVVNISSDAVYIDQNEPLTEHSLTAPNSLHGVMHLAREIMFQTLPMPLAIVRPTLVYGARDPHNGYGPNKFRRLANKNETITLFGKGEERRDHVSVDDVAELTARIIAHRSTGILNAASGTVTSFRDIAANAIALSGKSSAMLESPRSGPMPHNGYRPFAVDATYAAFPDFRYTPIAEGMKRAQQEEFGDAAG